MPKISIIIPVYNVEKYLRECLDSIIAQTVTDWECICVDDDSTDSSLAIMQEYAAKDKRFTAIHKEHSNAGHSRNVGLERATGEYLSFLDSDDVFAPRMFESLLEVASISHSDVVTYKMKNFRDGEMLPKFSNGWEKSRTKIIDDPAKNIDVFACFSSRAWEKLFKATLIRDNGIVFQEIRSSNDGRFTYTALSLAKRVTLLDDIFVARRLHCDSLEATRSKGIDCLRLTQLSFVEEMTKYGVFPSNKFLLKNFRFWCLHIFMWHIDTIDGSDAFEAAFQSLKNACEEMSLLSLLDEQDDAHADELELLRLLKNGGGILDYAVLRISQQRRSSYLHCQDSSKLERTLSFRIGSAITWLPRKIGAALRKRRMERAFDAKCGR